MTARALAAQILVEVITQHQSLTRALKLLEKQSSLKTSDIGFAKELCYGVLRTYHELKALTELLLHTPLKSKDADIFCLLLIGLYQLQYLDTPEYAAVSATVNAAKSLKKSWATGLLNKVLRRFIKEKASLLENIHRNPEARYLHPSWLIKKVQNAWPDDWKKILSANNTQAPLFIRIHQSKIDRDEYLSLLQDHDIDCQAIASLPQSIHIFKPLPVKSIPGFQEGYSSVQDISGQWIPKLLDIAPQQRILDACAAPGSKTCHILETAPQLQQFVAIDNDSDRMALLKENLIRLELNQQDLRLVLADASHTQQWWDGNLFDRILLDAPCSGTGVIRRHPDIKLLRREKDIAQLAIQQLFLLNALWPLIRKGGKLLYSTCSILPDENDNTISRFISQHKDAKVDSLNIETATALKYGYQLLPTIDGSDGFYFARITKN